MDQILRERLKQKEREYKLALEEYKRLSQLAIDAALVNPSNGTNGFEQSRRRVSESTEAYMRVLKEFTEYILHRKLPDSN